MADSKYKNLKRARDEDRRDNFEEEKSSMTQNQQQHQSSSSDDDDAFRPSFGGFNPQPGYDAKLAKKRRLERDAVGNTEDGATFSKYSVDNFGNTAGREEIESGGSSNFAMKYMKKFGFEEGTGLGKNRTGITEPISAVGNVRRRGLGDEAGKALQLEISARWDDSIENKQVEEEPLFLECPSDIREEIVVKSSWIKIGQPKMTIDDEDQFCDRTVITEMLNSKTVFDHLTDRELHLARIRANPFETIKSAIFQNRAAVKMANLDKIFNWSLSQEFDEKIRHEKCPMESGSRSLNDHSRTLPTFYFADVCAGPGGFSEYLIWRKAFYNCHGFGFTLRGECDFKLEKFVAGSKCYFDPYYGPKDNGDIYDPENLEALEKYIKERTEGQGLHLVTADGGFSVEGQENIQEILSKRLYLCQFIAALSLCRVQTGAHPGGNFVCKLFDILTPFSVGLVYLMYLAFEKISLHKPITSRPANSERYIYCENLTKFGEEYIKKHLIEVNNKLHGFASAKKDKELDVSEVIPLDMIRKDEEFFNYIVAHNERSTRIQTMYLQKYLVFAKNPGQRDKDQGEIREKALVYWEIPSIDRKAMAADKMRPVNMDFSVFSKDLNGRQLARMKKLTLPEFVPLFPPKEIFHEEFHFQFTFSKQHPFILLSDQKEQTYAREFDDAGFQTRSEYPNFPKQTLLLVEKAVRMMNGKSNDILRILDAAVLNGDNVSKLPLIARLEAARKFAKALTIRDKQPEVVVASASLIIPVNLEAAVQTMFSSANSEVPFIRTDDQLHYYYPVYGIRLPRAYKPSHYKCWSKSGGHKYYFNSTTNGTFEQKQGYSLAASFWDNVSENTFHVNWKPTSHSKANGEDILEKNYHEDVMTMPAIVSHISKFARDWCEAASISTKDVLGH